MSLPSEISESDSYGAQLLAWLRLSGTLLIRSPSARHRYEGLRRLGREVLWIAIVGAVLVGAFMLFVDAAEISMMPPRKSPDLWLASFLTDFGKDENVLTLLALVAVVIVLIFPLRRGNSRSQLLRYGAFVEYLFFAVLIPLIFTEIIKRAVGRGRPFVGGKADPFNFLPFHGVEPYFSFPSAHSVTAFALGFGVAAIWPRWRIPMLIYAFIIIATRLVLLAHHPSDVTGGAIIGLLGALGLRYWFAAREIGFTIEPDGKIVPR